jgi:hypothetical protein
MPEDVRGRVQGRLRIANALTKLHSSGAIAHLVMPGEHINTDNFARCFAPDADDASKLDINHYTPYFFAIIRGVLIEALLSCGAASASKMN